MKNELILLPQEERRLIALKTLPDQYCKGLNPKKVEDVFLSFEPSIGTIIKEFGETKARAAVVYLMADALEFFNASETMSDTQVATTVDLIIEEYPYMKTDDIKLCFKNAMKMKYGKIYNRIDGSIVMGWFREYNKERCAVADNQSWDEHKAHKSEALKPTNGLFYADYLEELRAKADNGDKEALEALSRSDAISRFLARRRSETQMRLYGKTKPINSYTDEE
ncbi:MAG: DUF6633 family protein [Bacteroides sp.]